MPCGLFGVALLPKTNADLVIFESKHKTLQARLNKPRDISVALQ